MIPRPADANADAMLAGANVNLCAGGRGDSDGRSSGSDQKQFLHAVLPYVELWRLNGAAMRSFRTERRVYFFRKPELLPAGTRL